MTAAIKLNDIKIEVERKNIKNVHLSVYPPNGRVRVAAPAHMNMNTIRIFAISKLGWIRKQQKRLRSQERESPREYVDRESHYVWGRRYLLKVIERESAPEVILGHRTLYLYVRPNTDTDKRRAIIDRWYRDQVREHAAPLIKKFERKLGVTSENLFVQHMKTRWGGCNHLSRNIRLNTELAKKPPECLEYIVLHELAHIREPRHSSAFIKLLDRLMPSWMHQRELLNSLPIVTV